MIEVTLNGQRTLQFIACIGLSVWALAGCGGSTSTTSTPEPPNLHAIVLGHKISSSLAMFSGGPRSVLRQFDQQFRRLPLGQQRIAIRVVTRDLDHQGLRITQGTARTLLVGLVAMRKGGP